MSRSFRPVQEKWGTASSCFVDDIAALLSILAEQAKCGKFEATPYGDHVSLWIERGEKFLDAVESYDSRPSSVIAVKGSEIQALHLVCANMKALACEWRNSIGGDGSLTFYIDAY